MDCCIIVEKKEKIRLYEWCINMFKEDVDNREQIKKDG